MNKILFMIDRVSAWSGKAFAWAVLLLVRPVRGVVHGA